MFIWDIEFKQSSNDSNATHQSPEKPKAEVPSKDSSLYVPPEPALRSTIPLHQQEITLTDEKSIISGSFIDVERKVDGVKTFQRVFLN